MSRPGEGFAAGPNFASTGSEATSAPIVSQQSGLCAVLLPRQLRRAIPYPAELFAGLTRGHCGRPALAMLTTWMTAPSVITPRNANKLRKAKQQLSGTAKASNKSRFMAKCVCPWLRRLTPNSSPPHRSDNAVQKISELRAMSDARQIWPRPVNSCAKNCTQPSASWWSDVRPIRNWRGRITERGENTRSRRHGTSGNESRGGCGAPADRRSAKCLVLRPSEKLVTLCDRTLMV